MWRADRASSLRLPAMLLGLVATLWAAPAAAQRVAAPSWLTLDTSADVDRAVDANGATTGGAIFDAYVAARVAPGLEIVTRPWVQRQVSGDWNRQIWLAALRYEHKGSIGVRVEGGLITSPVGLSNLSLRPHLNPTVAQPSTLFQGLPPPEALSPRITLLGAIYPLGVSTTVSGTHWDLRGAVIDTSPVRARRTFGNNPPRFTNIVVGGGITPIVGLRVGGSMTRGPWRAADELPLSPSDRMATVVTVEAEWAFRYTKLQGEWTRDRLETNLGHAVESGWYVQGQQTLTARWFVAGRVERLDGPPLLAQPLGPRQTFAGAEETVGFRITPEITLRASYRARRLFSQPDYLHQAMASVVWARRWF
jgi:hypothetical protein